MLRFGRNGFGRSIMLIIHSHTAHNVTESGLAHTHTHTHTHTQTHKHTHSTPHAQNIYMHSHQLSLSHIHTCTHAHTHTCTHAHTQVKGPIGHFIYEGKGQYLLHGKHRGVAKQLSMLAGGTGITPILQVRVRVRAVCWWNGHHTHPKAGVSVHVCVCVFLHARILMQEEHALHPGSNRRACECVCVSASHPCP